LFKIGNIKIVSINSKLFSFTQRTSGIPPVNTRPISSLWAKDIAWDIIPPLGASLGISETSAKC